MEAISRKTLIAEKKRDGVEMPDVESKFKTCELEKIREIKKINKPKEIWHQYAKYEIGTKLKIINAELYNNAEPHKDQTPKNWMETIDLTNNLNLTNEEWEEASHKMLYKKVKKKERK